MCPRGMTRQFALFAGSTQRAAASLDQISTFPRPCACKARHFTARIPAGPCHLQRQPRIMNRISVPQDADGTATSRQCRVSRTCAETTLVFGWHEKTTVVLACRSVFLRCAVHRGVDGTSQHNVAVHERDSELSQRRGRSDPCPSVCICAISQQRCGTQTMMASLIPFWLMSRPSLHCMPHRCCLRGGRKPPGMPHLL